MKYKVTPENIESLDPDKIFVFGSNLSGFHGAGAAWLAVSFGAINGNGVGLFGKTYAIPTKDENIKTLSLHRIKAHIDNFYDFVLGRTDLHFLVTKIGCGLAGYTVEEIAPLFGGKFLILENVSLPQEFIDILSPG